jgi:SpoIID/LytB domain
MRKSLSLSILIAIFILAYILLAKFPINILQASTSGIDFDNAISTYYSKNINLSLDKFRQLVNNYPNDQQIKLDLIQLLRETGQYNDAIIQLQTLADQDPQNKKYRQNLIQMNCLAGKYDETIKLSACNDLSANELFWRGLAFFELNKDKEALQAFNDSLSKEPFNPTAYFKLGELYQKSGDYEKSALSYKKAAAQEPNLTSVYFPLAQDYIASQKYSSAYNLLVNAQTIYPWDQNISATLKKLLVGHPDLTVQPENEAQKRRLVAVAPQVIPILKEREKIPVIRIGLAEKVGKFYLKTSDNFKILAGDAQCQGISQTILFIQQIGNKIQIMDDQNKPLFSSDKTITLQYNNPAATTVLFDVEYGQGTFWSGREDRVYRGSFDLLSREKGITIVNRINMEEYLYGVVPSEMEANWPQSALESQAVAARTYAIANLKTFESRGFDLLPTVASQVYRGVLVERSSSNAAVNATRGQILTYNEKPISAFYTANNGGYSSSSKDIWGFDAPYLQAVPDQLMSSTAPWRPANLAEWLTNRPQTYSSNPKYSGRSQYRWTLWVSRQDIENRLKMSDKLDQINSIVISKRGLGGTVSEVLVGGTNREYTINGDAIRSKLGGLRSNLFIVEPKMGKDGLPEYFIFYGGGWGHGVGMCQSGAAGMAADGYKCSEILSHYYPGTKLSALY